MRLDRSGPDSHNTRTENVAVFLTLPEGTMERCEGIVRWLPELYPDWKSIMEDGCRQLYVKVWKTGKEFAHDLECAYVHRLGDGVEEVRLIIPRSLYNRMRELSPFFPKNIIEAALVYRLDTLEEIRGKEEAERERVSREVNAAIDSAL